MFVEIMDAGLRSVVIEQTKVNVVMEVEDWMFEWKEDVVQEIKTVVPDVVVGH